MSKQQDGRLTLSDVVVSFGGLRAVDGVSLAIGQGEALGLVGESGCGKTTLAKAISGVTRPDSGWIRIDGMPLSAIRARSRVALARSVQMMHQDAVASLSPRMRVRDLLAEPLRIAGIHSLENWRIVLERLETMRLGPHVLDRYPHQLSGGQAKRVALLRAIVLDPQILVADEPTAGLDLSVQGDILNLMVKLRRQMNLTYVLVSHNLNVIGRVTDRLAVMYMGKIVELGETRAVFENTKHHYTAALISANPTLNAERRRERVVLHGELPNPLSPPEGCRFHTRCPAAQARCSMEEPRLQAAANGHSIACHFPLAGGQPDGSRPAAPAGTAEGELRA